MSKYFWELAPKAPDTFYRKYAQYPPQILDVLYARGFRTDDAIDAWFTKPSFERLPDPFLFSDMRRAVQRLQRAKDRKEHVVIHGDCDPDGACGAALLYELCMALGIDASVYLPDRENEGHAVSEAACKDIIGRNASLVLMVDVGIKENDTVQKFNEHSIDTIILDHHLPGKELPKALAIIDAHREGERYPFLWLCGTGIAFVFAQAAAKVFPDALPKEKLFSLLDFVAIATITDMVPLEGVNRIVLQLGIEHLQRTERPGIRALLKSARIAEGALDAHGIAFELGPRLNAASRFDHTDTAFALLTTENEERAGTLAKQMDRQNRMRQKELTQVTSEVLDGVNEEELPLVIVMAHERWSGAVLGIAASRVLQRFHRPVFLFRLRDGLARASARSIPGFDLVRAMRECGGSDLFQEFGGHAMAAGATLREDWLPLFRERINAYAKRVLTPEILRPALHVDLAIALHEATPQLLSWFERLAPFGKGNARPKILMRSLQVLDMQKVGKREQSVAVRLADRSTGRSLRAIARNSVLGEGVRVGDAVDTVAELRPDTWRGRNGVEINIIDIRHAQV